MTVILGSSRPPAFPPLWASGWGEDRIGVWAELTVKGVISRYRWIKPGRFTMGSPPNEPGRRDNEEQREVTIQHSFWLGDTTCTQALWRAVMGDNPSRFQGHDRPVEKVSWHDCQRFCEQLNVSVPGLSARLPFEAEWEYACRTGATTAFTFGKTITTDQVNYNATEPLEGSPVGSYREETVAVKALPANGWGLYQMHGNVLEWCLDPYSSSGESAESGPEDDAFRVLRGGSWSNSGRFVRSAFRVGFRRGARNHNIGFRLVPGPAHQAGRGRTAVEERRRSGQDLDSRREENQ